LTRLAPNVPLKPKTRVKSRPKSWILRLTPQPANPTIDKLSIVYDYTRRPVALRLVGP
jgi:hypothetical protein